MKDHMDHKDYSVVSDTAYLVAAARNALGQDYAAKIWRQLQERNISSQADFATLSPLIQGRLKAHIAVRQALVLGSFAQTGYHQFLDVGAGLSNNSLIVSKTTGWRCVDVDLPHMAALRIDLLGAIPSNYLRDIIIRGLDVTVPGALRTAAFGSLRAFEQVFVNVEGLAFYLELDDLRILLEELYHILIGQGGGQIILTTVLTQELLARLEQAPPEMQELVQTMTGETIAQIQQRAPSAAGLARLFENAGLYAELIDHRQFRGYIPHCQLQHLSEEDLEQALSSQTSYRLWPQLI